MKVDIERRRAVQKAYREANKEYFIARDKAYRAANRERIAKKEKAWREANAKHVKQREKNYREKEETKARNKATKRLYYLKNTEEIKQKVKNKYDENRELILKRRKQLRLALPDYYIASNIMGSKISDVPKELIEARKLVLLIRKEIKNEKRI